MKAKNKKRKEGKKKIPTALEIFRLNWVAQIFNL